MNKSLATKFDSVEITTKMFGRIRSGLNLVEESIWWGNLWIFDKIKKYFQKENWRIPFDVYWRAAIISAKSTEEIPWNIQVLNANRIVTMILINLNIGKLMAHINWIAKRSSDEIAKLTFRRIKYFNWVNICWEFLCTNVWFMRNTRKLPAEAYFLKWYLENILWYAVA